MIELLPKILFFKLFYHTGFPRLMPINYTISALYRCNSKCKTCRVWQKEAQELSLAEYEKIFKKIGKTPYWLTISGGEPFLREDLVELCQVIYNVSHPRIINIPSNGLLTKKIISDIKKITEICKRSKIVVNLSIDGIGEEHDQIRQVPGNYAKVIATYKQLKSLKIRNLTVGIHTVISRYNVHNFRSIANSLIALKPDSYITEIAENREELNTCDLNITPDIISYRSAIDFLIHRLKNNQYSGLSKITQSFRIEYYKMVKKILRDKTQIIPCYAGILSAQIAPDGEVWSCCIKARSLGNLRDHNYNFRRIWFSNKANIERRSIKNKECYCPLANAAYTNMLMHIPTLMRVISRSFFKK